MAQQPPELPHTDQVRQVQDPHDGVMSTQAPELNSAETLNSQLEATAKRLHNACDAGDIGQVNNILSAGGNLSKLLSSQNQSKQTPLHVAAECGYYEIVELILDTCTEDNLSTILNIYDIGGFAPYHSALKKVKSKSGKQDFERTAKSLLAKHKHFEKDWHKKKTNRSNDSHLHNLIHNEFSVDLIKIHLTLLSSYENQDKTVYGINERNKEGYTPLYLAASGSSPEVVKLLLEYKANPAFEDEQGNDCLHIAVQANRHENVKIFLDNDTKEDILKSIFYLTKNQKSVFHVAAESADIRMLELLFQYLIVLYKALERQGPREMKEWILSHVDKDENTAAHLAAKAGKVDNYKYLVSLGTKVSIPNAAGETAEGLFSIYCTSPRPSLTASRNSRSTSAQHHADAPSLPQSSTSSAHSVAQSGSPLNPPRGSSNAGAGVAVSAVAHSGRNGDSAGANNSVSASVDSASSAVIAVNNTESKSFLGRAWDKVSNSSFGKWFSKNRKPILILGISSLIILAALSTYIGLSFVFPGSSFFSAIPIAFAVHAAFAAFHIPLTGPALVAVSVLSPEILYPFAVAAIYDAYVAVKGLINLGAFIKGVITRHAAERAKIAAGIDYVQDPLTKSDVDAPLAQVGIPASAVEEQLAANNLSSEDLQSKGQQNAVARDRAALISEDALKIRRIEPVSREIDSPKGSSASTSSEKVIRRLSTEDGKANPASISDATSANELLIASGSTSAQQQSHSSNGITRKISVPPPNVSYDSLINWAENEKAIAEYNKREAAKLINIIPKLINGLMFTLFGSPNPVPASTQSCAVQATQAHPPQPRDVSSRGRVIS